MNRLKNREGLAMLLVLGYLAVLMTGSAVFFSLLNGTLSQAHAREESRYCRNLAEAGIEKAIAELRRNPAGYRGEQDVLLGKGRFSVEVAPAETPFAYRVMSKGFLCDGGMARKQARIVADVSLAADGRVALLRWLEEKT
ncbi:MAG TPA: hypothetical protein P5318_16700 [Candidatus Hydrogenedentes bacterium]|nr:hypothetical protein [Candidatus Hydrogenedentota bacterium]HPC16696.1 hypothetical protein [Candidatus Hydrogenedentota bacterium]HRT21756.1 hypothetical protein [Candidatus Hydrogenedentota bacterium]HRT65339.1 hypothetical protein [Candidatus Hydrogenedentota bacterium]